MWWHWSFLFQVDDNLWLSSSHVVSGQTVKPVVGLNKMRSSLSIDVNGHSSSEAVMSFTSVGQLLHNKGFWQVQFSHTEPFLQTRVCVLEGSKLARLLLPLLEFVFNIELVEMELLLAKCTTVTMEPKGLGLGNHTRAKNFNKIWHQMIKDPFGSKLQQIDSSSCYMTVV